MIQKGMKGKGIQITDASWLLLALEIFNKCFDGIDGTKDTANDAKECCQQTKCKLVELFVTPTSEFKITGNREQKHESTVTKSANETHEV